MTFSSGASHGRSQRLAQLPEVSALNRLREIAIVMTILVELAFAHIEEIAASNGPGADPINLTFQHVDLALLEEQANFFFYVKDNINYLNYKRRQLAGEIGAGAQLRVPVVVPRPRLHL